MKQRTNFIPPINKNSFHKKQNKDSTNPMFLPPFRIFKILLAYCVYKTVPKFTLPDSLLFPLKIPFPVLPNITFAKNRKMSKKDVEDSMHPNGLKDMMYLTLFL